MDYILKERSDNMTLKDIYSKPLSQILEQLDMVDLKVHSDTNGNINAIEIKYAVHTDFEKDKSKWR